LKHVEAINCNKLKINNTYCRSYYTDILESGYLKDNVTDTISSTPFQYLLHHTTIYFGSPAQSSLYIPCTLTTSLKLIYPEDERSTILRNICTYLPVHKSKHQRREFVFQSVVKKIYKDNKKYVNLNLDCVNEEKGFSVRLCCSVGSEIDI
jgi:hypothetical protein